VLEAVDAPSASRAWPVPRPVSVEWWRSLPALSKPGSVAADEQHAHYA
jgi:hypothetical protein